MRATIAAIGVSAALMAPAAAEPVPMPQVEGVPVLGQAWIGNVADDRLAVLSIHGLRRAEGATVLYYSLGLSAADRSSGGAAFFSSYGNGNNYVLNKDSAVSLVCTAAAIDVASSVAYSALRTNGSGACLSTPSGDLNAPAADLGRAPVGWVLLAPVPDSLTEVDVLVGSQLVQQVPVEDGLLEPTVPDPAPAVGTGWPTVDLSGVPAVPDPQGSVFALRSQVSDVEKKVTKAKRQGSQELDLDAAVLFATDQATLTPQANAVITEAALQIAAAATSGGIVVTGHTDSNASDSYNLALSERRADAVAEALKPKLPAGITIRTAGKGESEPIADNTTAEGRALNRRVTITLPR